MPISPTIATADDFDTISELKVYELFNKIVGDSDDKWVFANVNYVDTGRKLNGQVDFIYLEREIILFIEVKGGTINFDERTKRITKDYNGVKKDPFKQVTDYLYDFRDKKISKRFQNEFFEQKLAFGYCVLLPDGAKPQNFKDEFSKGEGIWTIEYSPKFIGDIDDLTYSQSFSNFLEKIKTFWKSHRHNKDHNGLLPEELLRLSQFIRNNLSFEIPLPKYLQINEQQTTYYTKQQGETILNLISKNKYFGFVINGGPGTGKTLIARELLVKRKALEEKVLFICRNKSLADFLRNDIREENPKLLENTTIIHTYGLFEQSLKSNNINLEKDFISERDISFTLLENKQYLKNIETFDYIIIDEGQDLFFRENIEALELYLKGGFNSKHFSIFMDKDLQNSYGDFDIDYFAEFVTKYKAFEYELTKNCRNTKGIIDNSNLYTGVKKCECMKTSNQKEKPVFWESENELLNLIKIKTNELLNKNVSKKQITILTESSLIDKIVNEDIYRYAKWDQNQDFKFFDDRIMVMTPESFKGLDNNIIIFTGTTKFDPEQNSHVALWHIAFTRAKDSLYILVNSSHRSTLNKISIQNIKFFENEN